MRWVLSLLLTTIFTNCGNTDEKYEKNKTVENVKASNESESINKNKAIVFNRKKEPRENAFSVLVPKDWQIEGGIYRVDPTLQGGTAQSIAAKLDFSIKNDANGSVTMRWLPDVLYFDARNTPAGQMGLFPQGSNYQGMTVLNIMSAEQFIKKVAFPYAHPQASNVRTTETKNLTKVANQYGQRVKQAIPYSTMSYDAALVKLIYKENGKQFEEWMVSIIENWGQLGAGMWGNKETFHIRAPLGKLTKWEPILSVVQNSVKINVQWLVGEINGQATRGEIAAKTQKEIERIGQEISAHRQKTNTEIHNDMYLTLTEKEEYVNPYTNEIEVGTDQWQHRWVNEGGDVIYTDSEDYDPNVDVKLNRSDYRKSKIRKRFPK